MKVHFNYKGKDSKQEVQIVIEDNNYEELFVSRFYKNEADLIAAFNENNLEKEIKDDTNYNYIPYGE